MFMDLLHNMLNLILSLFLLRYAQIKLIDKDSDMGKALSYLLH